MVEVAAGAVNAQSAAGRVLAERFEDPENARTILLMAGGLALLGVLVAGGTFLWWRSCRLDHPALGPLEVMGTRSWWKGDYASRRRRLEAARPPGMPAAADASAGGIAEPVDLGAIAHDAPPTFDDLRDESWTPAPPPIEIDDALLSALITVANGQAAETSESTDAAAQPDVEPDVEPARVPIDPLLRSPSSE